jgi:hypothetical protein
MHIHSQFIYQYRNTILINVYILKNYTAGGDIDYDKTPVRDVHEVAGVIKLYFRELTEPLVPTAMMREFVNAGANGMP